MESDGGIEPRVSVVVLTHNRCDEVCRTLTRLSELCERMPIIVVDNGSIDQTARWIEDQFPDIMLIRAGRNLGAAGRNLGVDRITTPYVAFCDDDTWWGPDALSRAVGILDSRPELTVLNARILVGPQARVDATCQAMAHSPLAPVDGVGPRLVGFMAGANVMRTQAFRDAGGYWPPFFIGGEESLLAMDILEAGGVIAYAPALELFHWPSPARQRSLRRRMIARNALWTAWLRLPAALALRRSVRCLAGLPGLRARLYAVYDALRGWRLVCRHRRCVSPATRRMLEQVWRHERSMHTKD